MIKEPVVIAGAGPVGMTLANMLSLNGISVIVLEKEEAPSKEWRASTFHAGTMELLEETGVTDEMLRRGLKAEKVHYRDRKTGLYAEFDFSALKVVTKYPFRLQCSQATYVEIVYEEIKHRSNVDFRFQNEVIEYTQDDEGVTVTVKTTQGLEEIRTPFLLGTDGGRSTVRKQLGVKFEGYTHEEKWLLVGTTRVFTDYIPDLQLVNYISDPEQFLFILHVPGAWRFLYGVPQDLSDEEILNPETIQRNIQKALNTTDDFPIIETNYYKIHQRVADTFYKNRVVLVGDAAHLNSPMGGLGLNSGIHDAMDLSKRLIRIFNEGSDFRAEFDKYNDARHRVAIDYVKEISEKNTRLLKETDEVNRIKLQKDMAELANDPVRAREWMLRSSMIASVKEQGIGDPPDSVIKTKN